MTILPCTVKDSLTYYRAKPPFGASFIQSFFVKTKSGGTNIHTIVR